MKLPVIIFSLAGLAPALALCDEAPPPQGVWTGAGQAGYVASHGNSDSTAANAAIDMALLEDAWKHALHLGGLYGQSSGVTSAERWDAMWQTNYDLSNDVYTFGNLHYTRDMFSGFQYQATGSVGLGYKLINDTATKLEAQLGVGYRELRPELLTKGVSGVTRVLEPAESSAVMTAGLIYTQALSDTTSLSNKLLIEYGSTDTLVTDSLALKVKVSNKLALSIGYNVQNNSAPPVGLKKLDTLETVNLVYAF